MHKRRRNGGEEPGDGKRDRGPSADPEAVARTIVLTKLTTRARSRHELSVALAEREVPPDVADRVLDRFAELGLVDDEAFAKAWVESRQSYRGLSRRALSMELHRKGIDSEIAAESLQAIDDDAEYAASLRLVQKKMRSTRSVDERARWRQLVGVLARKGYSPALCMRVVADALAEESATDEPSTAQVVPRTARR